MDTDPLAPYRALSTPHVADACMRLGVPVRCAPAALAPIQPETHVVGRVRPARHTGSVDVFLEAFERADAGDVLVVDNGGRTDEACVGDLVALEATDAGIAGVIIWGLHRDTRELREIGLPILSLGSSPTGPASLERQPADALIRARCGDHVVTADDFVVADDDGAIFLPLAQASAIAEAAARIRDTERRQAALVRSGTGLRAQLGFADYLQSRDAHGTTFRQHLRARGGAIEE